VQHNATSPANLNFAGVAICTGTFRATIAAS
jgi:hypothetical protein